MGHETFVEVDDVKWFSGYGPADPVGPCSHKGCPHNATSVIAWGPSHEFYELVKCDVKDGCDSRCRQWLIATPTSRGGMDGINYHPWLQVAPADLESVSRADRELSP